MTVNGEREGKGMERIEIIQGDITKVKLMLL